MLQLSSETQTHNYNFHIINCIVHLEIFVHNSYTRYLEFQTSKFSRLCAICCSLNICSLCWKIPLLCWHCALCFPDYYAENSADIMDTSLPNRELHTITLTASLGWRSLPLLLYKWLECTTITMLKAYKYQMHLYCFKMAGPHSHAPFPHA